MIDVSIVIVSYNSEKFILPCLNSIQSQTKNNSYEVILVDNNSSDDTVEVVRNKFAKVQIIQNSDNRGFGAANNQGTQLAKGKFLFFLNPDTELQNNVLEIFRTQSSELSWSEAEIPIHREAQVFGGNLVDAEGKPVFSYGNLPSIKQQLFDLGLNKLFPKYYQRNLAPALSVSSSSSVSSLLKVGYICGANLFVSKNQFELVGGFDEKYFMYWEEVDFCKKLSELSYQSSVIPDAVILHHESTSTNDENGDFNYKKYKMLERSKYLYFRKHYGKWSVGLLKMIQIISLLLHSPFTNQSFTKSIKITLSF